MLFCIKLKYFLLLWSLDIGRFCVYSIPHNVWRLHTDQIHPLESPPVSCVEVASLRLPAYVCHGTLPQNDGFPPLWLKGSCFPKWRSASILGSSSWVRVRWNGTSTCWLVRCWQWCGHCCRHDHPSIFQPSPMVMNLQYWMKELDFYLFGSMEASTVQ